MAYLNSPLYLEFNYLMMVYDTCLLFNQFFFIMAGVIRDTTGHYHDAYIFSGSVLLIFTFIYTCVDVWLLWKLKHEEEFDTELPDYAEGHVARYRHDSISTI